jgi:hypothetical protein
MYIAWHITAYIKPAGRCIYMHEHATQHDMAGAITRAQSVKIAAATHAIHTHIHTYTCTHIHICRIKIVLMAEVKHLRRPLKPQTTYTHTHTRTHTHKHTRNIYIYILYIYIYGQGKGRFGSRSQTFKTFRSVITESYVIFLSTLNRSSLHIHDKLEGLSTHLETLSLDRKLSVQVAKFQANL